MSPAPRPPSLGDGGADNLVRMSFTSPLPRKREELVKAFANIINQGNVVKVIVEVGEPIIYERMVKEESIEIVPDLEEIQRDDLFGAVRNNELVEFSLRGESGIFETLFFAMRYVSENDKRIFTKAFLCSNWELLRNMFGMDKSNEPLASLFGVPAYHHDDVPNDVLLLVAGSMAEPDVVVQSLRIPLDADDGVLRKTRHLLGEGKR
jgi:hypothetical protein